MTPIASSTSSIAVKAIAAIAAKFRQDPHSARRQYLNVLHLAHHPVRARTLPRHDIGQRLYWFAFGDQVQRRKGYLQTTVFR